MKIGIIACGAIVREVLAVASRLQWDFELTAVPAQYHNSPEDIAPAVARRLDEWASGFDVIVVGYADCGTKGALDALVARYDHVVRIPGPHCYEFFAGQTFQEQALAHPGTFYLTDFLARHFERLVWDGLGLNRYPELAQAYFGHYTDVHYLQQMNGEGEGRRAEAAAVRLGVRYTRLYTGLEELEKRLISLVEQVRTPSAAAEL